jgi:hypothetical protein
MIAVLPNLGVGLDVLYFSPLDFGLSRILFKEGVVSS